MTVSFSWSPREYTFFRSSSVMVRELVSLTLKSFLRGPVRVGGSISTIAPLTWLRCWCMVQLMASWRR